MIKYLLLGLAGLVGVMFLVIQGQGSKAKLLQLALSKLKFLQKDQDNVREMNKTEAELASAVKNLETLNKEEPKAEDLTPKEVEDYWNKKK